MSNKVKKFLIGSGAIVTIVGSVAVGNQIESCDYKIPFEEDGTQYEVCLNEEQYNAVKEEFGLKFTDKINGKSLEELTFEELL